jgi:PPIC-type PPIASE domain
MQIICVFNDFVFLREVVMKKVLGLFIMTITAFVISGCGGATSSGDVLVDINGEKITKGDIIFLGEINPRIKAQLSSPSGEQRILDNLIEQDLLYQEAVKEGINREPKVKAKVDLYRRVIIAQSLVDDAIDKAATKYYEDHADEFKKLRFSQILIKFSSPGEIKKGKRAKKRKDSPKLHTEKQALKLANAIKAKLDKGGNFAQLAREDSEDLSTKGRGGDMGLISKTDKRLIARGYDPLLNKAFELKVGEVAGPIKTNNGYSLITVTRGIEVEPFDEAKRSILFKVRNDARQELIAKLKKDATIVFPGKEKKAAAQAKSGKAEPTKIDLKKAVEQMKLKVNGKGKGPGKGAGKGEGKGAGKGAKAPTK